MATFGHPRLIGGNVMDGYHQGEKAIDIVIRILQGENIADIPIEEMPTSQFMFSYPQLKRFNINISDLPEDSIIINKPVSFYMQNKQVVWIAFGVFTFLLAISLFLALNTIRSRKTDQERRENEEKLRLLFDKSPIGICTVDLLGNFVTTNSVYEQMLGYSKEELRELSFFDVTHSEYRPKNKELFQNMFSLESNGFKMEKIYVRKDDRVINVSVNAIAVIDDNGNTRFGTAFVEDITERTRNERKLSLQSEIITRMSEGVSLVGEDGILIYTNPGFEKMFGYDSGEMIGLHVSIVNAPTEENPEETAKKILNSLNNEGTWFGEIQNIKKDGTTFWSAANVTAMEHLKHGKAFVSVHTDISELKQTKSEKKNLEVKLQQAQKMESIGNLAGGIAHDFNNLLYPIIGFSEMLKEDLPPDSPEYESAQEIFNAGKRGGELVKQILAFSRQSEHKLSPVRFQKILTEVLKLTRSTIPSDIEIHHDIQQNCSSVMAESTQLHQISMNLMTNAYHAVENASGIISVQLKEISMEGGELEDSPLKPGQYAMLSVSDNGVGIPRNVINNIFEPYFTTKEKGKGTGLGLAVVYGIVKEHKGDIKVYSEEGKGTTFNVYIPSIKKTTGIEANDPGSVLPTGTESLLLVDDEESVVRLEKQMLERLGYKVVAQSSSIDALELFKANPDNYDLVVTDMTMPKMTGDKLAKEILSIRSDIPVIICTGFSERINKEQAEAIGVNGFLMKPVVKFEMAQMVRKVLDEA